MTSRIMRPIVGVTLRGSYQTCSAAMRSTATLVVKSIRAAAHSRSFGDPTEDVTIAAFTWMPCLSRTSSWSTSLLVSAQSSHAKNHLLFLMPSLTSSLTCPDIQDLKMTFHLAASDAATAIFVVDRTIPPYTTFKCSTRYTALPEWDFEKVIAFEETRDDASHLNCVVMVRRRPKVYLLKLASFSTVPNYIALLAFIFLCISLRH